MKKRGNFLAGNASAAMARAEAREELEREVKVSLKLTLSPRTGAVTLVSSTTSVAVGVGSTTMTSSAVAEPAMDVTISELASTAAISPERTDLVDFMGLPCRYLSVDCNSKGGELSPDLTIFRATFWTYRTFERESVHMELSANPHFICLFVAVFGRNHGSRGGNQSCESLANRHRRTNILNELTAIARIQTVFVHQKYG
ncbi:MAG: hypothetical protein RLZZ426_184 [Actinomycetota bacterium]